MYFFLPMFAMLASSRICFFSSVPLWIIFSRCDVSGSNTRVGQRKCNKALHRETILYKQSQLLTLCSDNQTNIGESIIDLYSFVRSPCKMSADLVSRTQSFFSDMNMPKFKNCSWYLCRPNCFWDLINRLLTFELSIELLSMFYLRIKISNYY